ncbi:MAG: type VII toxin-antitoxin system MntA family adenylyltransferase antitoxin [Dissulfuribacterales bacterium]
MTSLKIKKKLSRIAPEIFEDFPILFAYLYGSIAIDQAHPFSDLDIAIYVTPALSIKDSLSLEMSLSLEIGKNMENGPPSDIRIMNRLPLTIAGQIVTDGILIYCRDDNARIDYETAIRSAYFDFLPAIYNFQKEFLEYIAD